MSTGAIIGVVVVILIIKIAIIIFVMRKRSKLKAERRARGCTCYGNTEYYCLPWWYWMSDSHCKCGALSNVPPVSNVQPVSNGPPIYGATPGLEPVRSTDQRTGMGATSWNQNSWNQSPNPTELKPAQQVYVNQRYYEGV